MGKNSKEIVSYGPIGQDSFQDKATIKVQLLKIIFSSNITKEKCTMVC